MQHRGLTSACTRPPEARPSSTSGGAARDARRYAAVPLEGKHQTYESVGSDVIAPRSGFSGSWTPHNKRMHATARSAAFISLVQGGA
jgi:hypothetical protein